MKHVHSMVVALDGESKCGKTTIVDGIKAEAIHQANHYAELSRQVQAEPRMMQYAHTAISRLVHNTAFNAVTNISAGNAYRAVALYAMREAAKGHPRASFEAADAGNVRKLLQTKGVIDLLQTGKAIGKNVSKVAQLPGVHQLCAQLFAEDVLAAYHADGGGNLVIVDARDPVGTLGRTESIGTAAGQIHPGSIMPLYIDTPTAVAADRMAGDYSDNLWTVLYRRHLDATRTDFPVRRPETLLDDADEYFGQFMGPLRDCVATPYRLDNDHRIDLDNVQWFAGLVALKAHDAAIYAENAVAA